MVMADFQPPHCAAQRCSLQKLDKRWTNGIGRYGVIYGLEYSCTSWGPLKIHYCIFRNAACFHLPQGCAKRMHCRPLANRLNGTAIFISWARLVHPPASQTP